MLVIFALLACGQDECERLCEQTANRLKSCLQDWPAEWSDFDANGANQFERFCDNQWSDVRNDLEPRELDDALDQCDESADALTELQTAGQSCDVLRALYIE